MPIHLPRILTARAGGTQPDAGGRAAIALAHSRAIVLEDTGAGAEPQHYTLLGYRQTEKPACKGGRPNANFFRIRHKAMRALARSFRGQPFITGHDWGDVRARGGTIVESWADTPPDAEDELGIYTRVKVVEEWALRGFATGMIDRFSMGAFGLGEITCTIHNAPVWSEPDCWCWPGMEVGGLLCEWEYEDAQGVEMSAVNVPAVDGTGVVEPDELEAVADADPAAPAALERLAALCGRAVPARATAILTAAAGGAPKGGFTRPAPPITMTSMDREEMAKALGLPADATWEQIRAKQAEIIAQSEVLRAQNAELARDRDRVSDEAHAETEITRLRASRVVGDEVVASLRSAIKAGRVAFDASVALVEKSAPAIGAAPAARATLQSDAKPAPAAAAAQPEEGPDAFAAHQHNQHLPRMMKRCGVTAQNVREHGTAIVNVVPELADKIAETSARGE